ncbi:MAG: hypothetical protein HRU20_03925 [Pseudomonadales bacterium]|nr:hypothetical protein [Pseudomonadales bacterium]
MDLKETLQQGETPIQFAPSIRLKNGRNCIPQHYLSFSHSRASVEKLVLDINYSDRYPVFVCEHETGIYIQIGIVGVDNYQAAEQQKTKIVYGRKWHVEPELPTSEIIQTVLLAIKIAREHEERELFRFDLGQKTCTPFNTHLDLPLMADHSDLVSSSMKKPLAMDDSDNMDRIFKALSYDGAALCLTSIQVVAAEQWLLHVSISPRPGTQLPEIKTEHNNRGISLLIQSLDENTLYFELMQAFIRLSDRHVEEHFSYRGFRRFSHQNQVLSIAELSFYISQKKWLDNNKAFKSTFNRINSATDQSRVPRLAEGLLASKIQNQLAVFSELEGFLPVLG